MIRFKSLVACSALALVAATVPAAAQPAWTKPVSRDTSQEVGSLDMPTILEDVGFDQHLGEQLPPDLTFLDETGRTVRLGDYFGDRPLVVVPVYYDCPMLCSMVMAGLASGLKPVDFDPGRDFDVLVVSFDPRDEPEDAVRARKDVLHRYGRDGTEAGFHFLTGEETEVTALMSAMGFRYGWDEERQQFIHAAGIILTTPEGVVSHYLFGIEFAPRDIRLGLIEATDNQIGNVIDQALLFCFQYDPALGKYSAVTMNIVRLGGIVTFAALALFIAIMLRRDRSRRPQLGEA